MPMGMDVPGERTETEGPVGGEYGGFCLGRVGSEVSVDHPQGSVLPG